MYQKREEYNQKYKNKQTKPMVFGLESHVSVSWFKRA